MQKLRLLLLSACFGLAVCAQSRAAEISIHGVDFGIFRIKGEGAGRVAELVQKTDRIPAKRGTTFGVMVDVHGSKDDGARMLRRITRFPAPGLRDPRTGKTRAYRETQLAVRVGDTLHALFTFDHTWEMVPGTWSIEYWLGDEKLIGKEFTVVR